YLPRPPPSRVADRTRVGGHRRVVSSSGSSYVFGLTKALAGAAPGRTLRCRCPLFLVESQGSGEVLQELSGDRLATEHAGRDRKCHRHLQMGRVVADPQLPCRPLVEPMDDLAELAAAQFSSRPPPKRLRDGEQGSPKLLLVAGGRVLTQEALDSFRHVSHTAVSFAAGIRRSQSLAPGRRSYTPQYAACTLAEEHKSAGGHRAKRPEPPRGHPRDRWCSRPVGISVRLP